MAIEIRQIVIKATSSAADNQKKSKDKSDSECDDKNAMTAAQKMAEAFTEMMRKDKER